jgi:hypothetical protein
MEDFVELQSACGTRRIWSVLILNLTTRSRWIVYLPCWSCKRTRKRPKMLNILQRFFLEIVNGFLKMGSMTPSLLLVNSNYQRFLFKKHTTPCRNFRIWQLQFCSLSIATSKWFLWFISVINNRNWGIWGFFLGNLLHGCPWTISNITTSFSTLTTSFLP